jgi:hypothetical protein
MVGEQGTGGSESTGTAHGNWIAEFLIRCPGWKLLMHDMSQPIALVRAERVVLVNGTAPLDVIAAQVSAVADAIEHPERPHPDVLVIEEA